MTKTELFNRVIYGQYFDYWKYNFDEDETENRHQIYEQILWEAGK